MDPRTKRHAVILTDYCTNVHSGDNVLIRAPAAADDLVIALYEQLGKCGAKPVTSWVNVQADRAYMNAMDIEDFAMKSHEHATIEETDVVIIIAGSKNNHEMSDVSPEKRAVSSRANQPIFENRLETTRWVITQHPTPADAQKAQMSTRAWSDFIYNSVNRNWSRQQEFQEKLAEIIDSAETLHIKRGTNTSLRMNINDMKSGNDYGKQNLPGGEVFTTPRRDSVCGKIEFDIPFLHHGQEISNAFLTFEEGEVIEYSAEQNERILSDLLETDEGARHVGEFGVGMNPGITQFTQNILFDEKMKNTIHIALGNAMEECVPDNQAFNESAIHIDMLVDMSEKSYIEIDGETIQKDGEFLF